MPTLSPRTSGRRPSESGFPQPERITTFASPYVHIENGLITINDLDDPKDRGIAFQQNRQALFQAGQYLYSRFRTNRYFLSSAVDDDSSELIAAGVSLACTDPFLAA